MLWNHEHKVAFCHTPRTGGSALREAFFVPYLGTLEWQHTGYKHSAWKELDRHTQDRIRDYTMICVHRNPYDRMISMYQHWIMRPGRDTERCVFEDWIQSTRYDLYPREHRLPQWHYCEGLPEHTIYIPFTDLHRAFDHIRNHVRQPLQFWLRKTNGSVEFVEPDRVLTPAALEWINQHHADDFRQFGYRKKH